MPLGRSILFAVSSASQLPTALDQLHASEVLSGERFEFGENWRGFLRMLDEDRITTAEDALREMLGVENLAGQRFLDVGCGSGLSSLAAHRLGADVHSFDFDPQSFACTGALRNRYAPGSQRWTVEHGSALDESYLRGLGLFDVVYSWGVLHHTGDMRRGLELAEIPVAPNGRLFISIYNDQGRRSHAWRAVKRGYNRLPGALRTPYVVAVMGPRELLVGLVYLLRGRPMDFVRRWTDYKRSRGMSRWHDFVDWVGGYPFEVAAPDAIFDFFRMRGFELQRLVVKDLGCNEYVFARRQG